MDFRFSVLISVYYKEISRYLDRAFQSITDDQVLKPNEIVLVKDGPLTKELDGVIEKYQKRYPNLFKIVALEKNYGLGKALNIGLKNCTYELVARMDGDDISKPERFKKQIDIFKENPNLDILGSWIDEFIEKDEEITVRSIRKVPEKSDEIYQKLKSICAFNHPTVMYRKSKVIGVGSYLQEFILEDYYLWIRLALNRANMYNIQESLLNFRITEGTSKRRGGIKLLKSDIKFQKKLYKSGFINKIELSKNLIKYFVYRLLSNNLRGIIQKKLYRSKKN
ncbi:glycosyltransferase [Fusobacterium mortiferum]|jgi:glycosyltransferase involved in cell wall biosynthesis|uniref:glycosyltransferase n=1 Tax=Fusobacterium mortiferum TaxID=850 RepID=UPI001F43BBBA|nr:glycosyltransferase [Fusobacterium mortiferum]MCF2700339.1 glycosyltransferase [Fusobacterium mortiferum]